MYLLVKFFLTILFVSLIFWISVLNRSEVSVSFSPFIDTLFIPMPLIILGSITVGFLWGSIIVWLNGTSTRSDVRRLRKEIKALATEKQKQDSPV